MPDSDAAVGNRIKSLLDGVNRDEAASVAGVSKNTLGRWMAGTSSADAKGLARLAKWRGVSLEWLIAGAVETPGAAIVRTLNETNRKFGEGLLLQMTRNATPPSDIAHIAIIDAFVSAGTGGDVVSHEPRGYWPMPVDLLRRLGDPERLQLVPIRGDSMEPELRDGDYAMVDTSRTDRAEGLLVLTVGDRLVAKRLRLAGGGRLQLVSTNPAYPPIDIEPNDELRIHGRVVWAGKAF